MVPGLEQLTPTARWQLWWQTAQNGAQRHDKDVSFWRFAADRRARFAARIDGVPTDSQAALVQTLIRLEWSACKAEAEGTLMGDRGGREHRRLFQRLLGDFERTLTQSAAKPSFADALGKIAAEVSGL